MSERGINREAIHDEFLRLPKVGLVGPNRVGKGAASEYLTSNEGYISTTLSQAIRDYAKEQNISLIKSEDFWNTRLLMEEKMGKDVLLQKSVEKIREVLKVSQTPPQGIVFDGIRTRPVAESFKQLPNALLLAIEASPQTRYARRRPERPEDSISFEDFLAYDQIEQQAIGELGDLVDVTIVNEGSLANYQKEIVVFLRNHFPRIS